MKRFTGSPQISLVPLLILVVLVCEGCDSSKAEKQRRIESDRAKINEYLQSMPHEGVSDEVSFYHRTRYREAAAFLAGNPTLEEPYMIVADLLWGKDDQGGEVGLLEIGWLEYETQAVGICLQIDGEDGTRTWRLPLFANDPRELKNRPLWRRSALAGCRVRVEYSAEPMPSLRPIATLGEIIAALTRNRLPEGDWAHEKVDVNGTPVDLLVHADALNTLPVQELVLLLPETAKGSPLKIAVYDGRGNMSDPVDVIMEMSTETLENVDLPR
ncbi:MAG TPA: hypothetical protein VM223_25300 [Planctomycetota bacterium]|nr:hypothetical protein [Planctomycetota bacterium]